jgi:hypothetical protein
MRTTLWQMLLIFSALAILTFACFGQSTKRENNLITARLFVENVPESAFAPGTVPSEDSYSVITYIAVHSNDKQLDKTLIKVAHFGESDKDLKVGDEICAQIRPTKRFREDAKVIFESFGIVLPEELIADFVYEGLSAKCE